MTAAMTAIAGEYKPAVVGYVTIRFGDEKWPSIGYHASGRDDKDFLTDVLRAHQLVTRRLKKSGVGPAQKPSIFYWKVEVCCWMAGEMLCLPRHFEGTFSSVMREIGMELGDLITQLYILPKQIRSDPKQVQLTAHEQITWLIATRHALARIANWGRRKKLW